MSDERILPGSIRVDDKALVRWGDKIIGRVISAREDVTGYNIGLRIDDPVAYEALLYGTAGLSAVAIPAGATVVTASVESEGEGLGWSNEHGCSDKRQDCNGTFDPERGCLCV